MAIKTINGAMLRDYQLNIARQIINGLINFVFLIYPRRSGKSLLSFYNANAFICKHKDRIVHVLIIAKEKAQTNEIYGKNLLENGMPLFSILPKSARYSKYDSEIIYPNGSTIKFNGADNIQAIVGGRYDMIIMDEFATWKAGTYELLYPCLRNPRNNYNMKNPDPDVLYSVLMIITTVRGKNHAFKLFERVQDKDLWLAVKTNVIELGLMTQEEYDELDMDPNYKAQEFMNDVDSAFVNAVFSRPNVVTRDITPGLPLYIGVDIAKLNDANAFTFGQIIDNELHIVKTLKYIGIVTDQIIIELKHEIQKIGSINNTRLFFPPDACIRSDVSGLSRLQHYQDAGFYCETVSGGVIETIDLVRSMWHKIKFYQGKNMCDGGIEDIKSFVADENGRPDMTTKNHKFSHTPDSLRYLCIGLERCGIMSAWRVPISKPLGKYIGMENYRVI